MTNRPAVNCSIARALGEVGERWGLLIVREAMMGSTRFNVLWLRHTGRWWLHQCSLAFDQVFTRMEHDCILHPQI